LLAAGCVRGERPASRVFLPARSAFYVRPGG
jgi:hypothetical protein